MYLLQLDEDTGLIKDDINNDGWKAIKVFRDLVKKHGIKGLTLVALSCDYLSPLSMYNDTDRPYRAMDELYESRKKFNLSDKIWLDAFSKYKSLQKNDEFELDNINRKIYSSLLDRYNKAAEQDEIDQAEIEKLSNDLYKHRDRMDKFQKSFDKADIIANHGVAQNGYVLSRIEQDIAYRRNSKFVNTEKELENPNKLGLLEKTD